MAYDFETVIDRRNTGSLKWARYAGTDILPLWVADMDFASPPEVIEALHRRVDHGVFGYSRPHAGLVEAALEYMDRAHGAKVEASWIHWMPGLVPALSMACGAVGEPGASVLTLTPIYPPFLMVADDTQRRTISVPLASNQETNGEWRIDFDALEAAVTPETKVFLFCNPHNPVGRAYTRAEVQGVVDFCLRHDLVLVSGEIHCDLVLDPDKTPHISLATFEGPIRDRMIVQLAASKTYNIAGLANAWCVIPNAKLRTAFIRAGGKFIPEISPLSFHATEAAYRHGEPWRQELLATLRGHRDFLADAVRTRLPGIKMAEPHEATYLAWLDCRDLGVENPGALFEKHGVGLSNGADFAAPGFLRLNFGCPRATLAEALDRMERAVASLR